MSNTSGFAKWSGFWPARNWPIEAAPKPITPTRPLKRIVLDSAKNAAKPENPHLLESPLESRTITAVALSPHYKAANCPYIHFSFRD